MSNKKLPPGQHEIDAILRWSIDHEGIIPENPKINLNSWKLIVDGDVENSVRFVWQDFLKLPSVESVSDFHCVETWSIRNCKWYGVKFSTLVNIVKPSKNARNVFFKCLDGYTTSLELKDLLKDNVLLAYKLNGKLLEVPLGGPVRLVVPDKYAYKSPMWIEQIAFMNRKELGYWEKKGYSDTADVWTGDRRTR